MVTIKDAISLANNIVNPVDAEKLKNYIYKLQQENLDFKFQLIECKTNLQIAQEWANTKKFYQEHKTEHGYIVYRKVEEIIEGIFYCPVCFDKKSIKQLQPIPHHLNKNKFHLITDIMLSRYCPSCEILYVL